MIDDKNIIGWVTITGATISVHDYQYLTDFQKSQCKPITKEFLLKQFSKSKHKI